MAVFGNNEPDEEVTTRTKRLASKMIIDEAAVLAASGEKRLEGVRQLIMRGTKLRSFDSACTVRLQNLTVGMLRWS